MLAAAIFCDWVVTAGVRSLEEANKMGVLFFFEEANKMGKQNGCPFFFS
jgi:hypothetical protein